jgi:hypothetical protein
LLRCVRLGPWGAGGCAGQRGARCRVGVQRVGLSFGSASLTVGAVHLDHGDTCGAQLPSQTRSVGPGPLHADPLKMAIRLQPAHQSSVAGRGRRKLSIAELATHGVERRCVVGLAVGVYTAGNIRRCGGHAGHCRPSSVCPDRSARGGWAGRQASDGRLCAGSYEVTPPDRARAKRHHPPGRRIPPRTANSRQAYGGSDPAGGARYILTGIRVAGLRRYHRQDGTPLGCAPGFVRRESARPEAIGLLAVLRKPQAGASPPGDRRVWRSRGSEVPRLRWRS